MNCPQQLQYFLGKNVSTPLRRRRQISSENITTYLPSLKLAPTTVDFPHEIYLENYTINYGCKTNEVLF